MDDKQFATKLTMIIGLLIGFTVVILALANALISDTDISGDIIVKGNIYDRIKPVANVALAGEVANAAETASSEGDDSNEPAASGRSGEQLYAQACSACHASGVLNAPKFGDKASWGPRLAKGADELYASAINGIGAMPAKGGRVDFSDADIQLVVDYMLGSVQ